MRWRSRRASASQGKTIVSVNISFRLIAVLGELMTDTATATMREVATATETVTFNVKVSSSHPYKDLHHPQLDHCTSAGFMFDQPLCS